MIGGEVKVPPQIPNFVLPTQLLHGIHTKEVSTIFAHEEFESFAFVDRWSSTLRQIRRHQRMEVGCPPPNFGECWTSFSLV